MRKTVYDLLFVPVYVNLCKLNSTHYVVNKTNDETDLINPKMDAGILT